MVIWLEGEHLDLVAKVQGLDANVRLFRVVPLLPLVNHLQEAVAKRLSRKSSLRQVFLEKKKKRKKKKKAGKQTNLSKLFTGLPSTSVTQTVALKPYM